MGKQEQKIKQTTVSSQNGEGRQIEQTYTVDDTNLPSPEELEKYKALDPNLLPFLLETAKKEQEHRHKMDNERISILKKNEKRVWSINWWGMVFAFLSIIVLSGVTALAIYWDSPWIAGILGVGTFGTVTGIFVTRNKK